MLLYLIINAIAAGDGVADKFDLQVLWSGGLYAACAFSVNALYAEGAVCGLGKLDDTDNRLRLGI